MAQSNGYRDRGRRTYYHGGGGGACSFASPLPPHRAPDCHYQDHSHLYCNHQSNYRPLAPPHYSQQPYASGGLQPPLPYPAPFLSNNPYNTSTTYPHHQHQEMYYERPSDQPLFDSCAGRPNPSQFSQNSRYARHAPPPTHDRQYQTCHLDRNDHRDYSNVQSAGGHHRNFQSNKGPTREFIGASSGNNISEHSESSASWEPNHKQRHGKTSKPSYERTQNERRNSHQPDHRPETFSRNMTKNRGMKHAMSIESLPGNFKENNTSGHGSSGGRGYFNQGQTHNFKRRDSSGSCISVESNISAREEPSLQSNTSENTRDHRKSKGRNYRGRGRGGLNNTHKSNRVQNMSDLRANEHDRSDSSDENGSELDEVSGDSTRKEPSLESSTSENTRGHRKSRGRNYRGRGQGGLNNIHRGGKVQNMSDLQTNKHDRSDSSDENGSELEEVSGDSTREKPSLESNTSENTRSHRKRRHRNYRGHGRGGQSNSQRDGKAQSISYLHAGEIESVEDSDENESALEKLSGDSNDRGKNVSELSEETQRKTEPPVCITKATLIINTYFTNNNDLKSIIRQVWETFEMSNLNFVDEATICSRERSLCTIIIHTENKQLGKQIIKTLCAKLQEMLKKSVKYDISNAEEKTQVSETASQMSMQQLESRKSQAEVKEDVKGRGVKTLNNPTSVNQTSETAVRTHTPTERCSSNEQVPVYSSVKVSLTITKSFAGKDDFENFMKRASGMLPSFEILTDQLVFSESKTLCVLQTHNKATAKKLVKQMNSSTFDNVKMRCKVVNDKTAMDVNSKEEKIKFEIEKTLNEIERRTTQVLEAHKGKIKKYEDDLNQMELAEINNEEDDERCEEQAVRDKLMEVLKQQVEFNFHLKDLKNKVKDFNSFAKSETELKDSNFFAKSELELKNVLKNVGVECERLTHALPIYARRKDIVRMVSSNQVSVILGETGSGKSTQMVQYIFEAGLAGNKQIVCTEPRKVAAITLAERVAKEMVVNVGSIVGYKTGVKKFVSDKTQIIFSTDHCLLNECLTDPDLSNYSCIIVDEAHERSIYTDILLGMIKKCLPKRPDLKVIITSATIDPEVFIKYFGCKKELRVSGRTFPVEVEYMETDSEFEKFESKAVEKAVEVHKGTEPGDILIFLTSPVEIMRCCEEFEKRMNGRNNFKCFPLHGQLAPSEQKKVFERLAEGIRKVVFATNCAETSVTIDGIKFVIDTGVAKEVRYDAKRNISLLGTYVISKSSADQRKGRAGRTSSGKCYRLYTKDGYEKMNAITEPEILRVHLGQAVLKLAEMGIDVKTYDFVQSPSDDAIDTALRTLWELGALSADGITDIGCWIAKLPFDPRQGYLVYEGMRNNLLYDSVVIAALISNGSNLFYKGLSESEKQIAARSKTQFESSHGDIFTWLEVYKEWVKVPRDKQSKWCADKCINYKIMNFTFQFVKEVATILKKELNTKLEFTFTNEESAKNTLRKIIFDANRLSLCYSYGHFRAGYFAHVVEKQVHLHPSSTLVTQNEQPEWIVYTEFTKTSRDFIKGITVVEENWVSEAVKNGKLTLDINQCKQFKISVVHKEEVGPSVFHCLVGPRFSHLSVLENELTTAGMAPVVVEADRKLLTVDIYSFSPMDPDCANKIYKSKTDVIEKLCLDENEIEIGKVTGKEQTGFRVILGEGGSVKTFLMPNQSNKILVKKSNYQTSEDELREKFKVYGNIIECVRFKHSDPWGLIRYKSFQEAHAAVVGTKMDESNVAILKINNQQHKVANKFEAKLSWCRRPIKGNGIAFIKCPDIDKAKLVGSCLYLSGNWCQIKVSNRDDGDLICFKTGRYVTEMDIKKEIMNILDYNEKDENKVRVDLLREKVDVPSKQKINEMKDLLSNEFANFLPKDKFSLNLIPPKANSVNQVAFIHFSNPITGFQACNALNGYLTINDELVQISPVLKTSIHVLKSIMKVCEKRFEDIKEGLALYKHTEIKIRQLQQGDFYIDINSTIPKCIIEARDLFQKELDGEVIDCGLNTIVANLLKPQGKEILDEIQKDLEVFIMRDDRREKIHIYGSEAKVSQAQIKINAYLSKLSEGEQVDIRLKAAGKPAGLMKALIQKYNNLQEDWIEEFGLSDVIIDFRQQKLSIIGSPQSVDKVQTFISQLENSLHMKASSQKEKWMPDCHVCMSPIEESSELYRLERCGHSYCLDCLNHQIVFDVDNKKFPILCVNGNCNKPMVWKDIQLSLRKKWITEEKLLQRSVNAFVTGNSTRYKFCLTPNCPVFYEVTEDEEGCEFNCPSCFASLCTSCHTAYHGGLTCKMVVSQKDKQFEMWKKANAHKCKDCPVCKSPVEKDSGCNKMHCFVCHTYFCWVCLEKAENEQKCYAHLVKVHGGFT